MDKKLLQNLPIAIQMQYRIQSEIIKGVYGAPGSQFCTTRKLAEQCGVSLVTAHNIMKLLCDSGYIVLEGKKYFLQYEKKIEKGSVQDKILGLIVPNVDNDYYNKIEKSLISKARQRGYQVLISDIAYSPSDEKKILETFKLIKIAGVISCTNLSENVSIYRNYPIPCVLLGHNIGESHRSSVQVNSFAISQSVARHLIDRGYKKFMYIGSDKIPLEKDIRFNAFRLELQACGFDLEKKDVFCLGPEDLDRSDGLSTKISQSIEPLGVFCFHDLLAASLYRLCGRLKKKVPDNVGIVGFDDLPIAQYLTPPMTSVHYRIESMVETALRLLFEQMEHPNGSYDNYYVDPALVVRKSCALNEILLTDREFV